jgi:hypothetical protein
MLELVGHIRVRIVGVTDRERAMMKNEHDTTIISRKTMIIISESKMSCACEGRISACSPRQAKHGDRPTTGP